MKQGDSIITAILSICCSKQSKQEKKLLSFTDDLGYKFEFDNYPKRIISIAPSITETIYAIGADSLLIGVSNYCNYPDDTKNKTKVGGLIDPNIEIIASLNPDIVLMTVEGNSKTTHAALQNAGLNVFTVNPRNIDGIMKMIFLFGDLTNKSESAKKLIQKIDSARKSIPGKEERIKSLILFSINPFISVNKTTYISEITDLCGYENIYANEKLPYPNINPEDISLKSPDCIILTSEIAVNDFRETLVKYFSISKAIKNNNIIILNADIISRPGPRIIDFISSLRLFTLN